MKKAYIYLAASVAFLILAISFLVTRVGATATRGQVGDECNVNAEDESHMCLQGLTCVPQNENSEGNGKCTDLNVSTPTPSASPSATPVISPTPTSSPTNSPESTPSGLPTSTPEGGSGVSDGRSDGLGCAEHSCNIQPGISAYDGSSVGMK